jgi:hypothetical protein
MTDIEHTLELFEERSFIQEIRLLPGDGMAGRRFEAPFARAGRIVLF